jgi:hypothetical protein
LVDETPRYVRTTTKEKLQARAVEDLQVDGELTTMVADDENANATTTRLEGFSETGPEVGLIDDGNSLLDIASLGHSNN